MLLLAPAGLLADEDLVVVREEEGYRITRPDATWRERPAALPATVHHGLRLEHAPAPAEVTLTIYQADVPAGASAAALMATTAEGWKRKAVGGVVLAATSTIAGETAPTLAWAMDLGGVRLAIRQHFLVKEGELLVVQCVAPAAGFSAQEAAFTAALASIAWLPADPARADARRFRLLAGRCGSEVPRARTWAEAAARAARDKRLVFVFFEQYHGLPIPPLADTTTFMDDDLVALCQERFVVLPWSDAVEAPFEDPATYGLGPGTFGQGALFVTPEGQVVGSLGLLEPGMVDVRARATLAGRPEATGSNPDPKDALLALRRGDLERAALLLAAPARGEEWRLRAALLARQHRADEALAALAKAAESRVDPQELAADRGLVLLRAARLSEAEEAFTAAGDLPRARYWLAVARAARVGLPGVQDELRTLAGGDPASRCTWRAAALLLGRGVATGMEALAWPPAAVEEAVVPVPSVVTPASEAQRAAADALAALLRTQLPDGTWPVPMSFTHDTTVPTVVAVTALAGKALLRRRGRPEVDIAVARALAAVRRAHARLLTTRGGVFDYTVWAQACALDFLAASARTGPPADAEHCRTAAGEIVQALHRTRAAGGGWSYANLGGAGLSTDNSISFLTAAVLLALVDARDAGVKLPDDLLARGCDVVASLRRKDGAFHYQTATPGSAGPTEAAFRGPLCLLALGRARKSPAVSASERAAVQAALSSACSAALKEAGKPLCHTAPDGTSAYYLLFGLRYAAEAVPLLPPDARATARRALLDAVLHLRRTDGSFCDFPPIGPAYGTALALETLAFLGP
jgi:tetratricopeptide (TPR) repeat protein